MGKRDCPCNRRDYDMVGDVEAIIFYHGAAPSEFGDGRGALPASVLVKVAVDIRVEALCQGNSLGTTIRPFGALG